MPGDLVSEFFGGSLGGLSPTRPFLKRLCNDLVVAILRPSPKFVRVITWLYPWCNFFFLFDPVIPNHC